MKKILASAFSLGCLVASMSAQAEEATAPAVLADNPVVSTTLKLETRFSLYDTTSEVKQAFFEKKVYLGANVSVGNATGKILLDFRGNNENSENSPAATGQAGVREAWINYSLAKKLTSYEVSVQLGRFMPNGAQAYGNDPVQNYWAGTYNIDFVDGLALNYTGTFGALNIAAQAGVASALPVWVFLSNDTMTATTSTIGSDDSSLQGKTNNKELAMFGNVQATFTVNDSIGVEGAFAYGQRNKSRIGTAASIAEQADLTYFETSAAVRYKSVLAVGGWYSEAKLANATTWDPSTDPAVYNSNPDVTTAYKVWGVGVQGDTSIFGIEDLVAKGDAFTYGISFQTMGKEGASTDNSDNDSTLASLGFGYMNSIFSTSLNYTYFSAKNDVFMQDDVAMKSNNAQRVYLVTTLAL